MPTYAARVFTASAWGVAQRLIESLVFICTASIDIPISSHAMAIKSVRPVLAIHAGAGGIRRLIFRIFGEWRVHTRATSIPLPDTGRRLVLAGRADTTRSMTP